MYFDSPKKTFMAAMTIMYVRVDEYMKAQATQTLPTGAGPCRTPCVCS